MLLLYEPRISQSSGIEPHLYESNRGEEKKIEKKKTCKTIRNDERGRIIEFQLFKRGR